MLAAASVAGFATRLWMLGDKSLWLDEAFSWKMARFPVPDMIRGTASDVHPPLLYLILHYWLDQYLNLHGDGAF